MPKATLYHGDVLQVLKSLPSESVHCCITSPPYWGLRDYGVDGQIGLEPTFDEWLAKMVEIFDEVRRVLHKSGTLWVNMGDSYNSAATRGTFGDQSKKGYADHGYKKSQLKGLHSKNLIGQPWRLAFALQASKWILRSDIIWHKPNPMPESTKDRPTSSHEYIHLFAKKDRYFYDQEAIALEHIDLADTLKQLDRQQRERNKGATGPGAGVHHKYDQVVSDATIDLAKARGSNRRTVWTIPTVPFPEAHFATFTPKLPELCIKAGTSQKGCCPRCLEPWAPVYEVVGVSKHGGKRKRADAPGAEVSPSSVFNTGEITERAITGWQQGCKCQGSSVYPGTGAAKQKLDPIPCTVLDIFSGSGTTGMVALRHQRDYIGIELNKDYLEMSVRRIRDDAPLFNTVEVIPCP